MHVVRLTLAYDGTDFHGWARQARHRTVEGVFLGVLEEVTGVRPRISVAGRTDAGVHARGQVISFATDADPEVIAGAVNGMLGPEVVVIAARRARDGFDARHSATAREYRYRLNLGPVADPFRVRFEWHHPGGLRVAAMRAAAKHLVGGHDFASFGRPPAAGAATFRRVERIALLRAGDRLEVAVRANAFLRQMVRSIVGTLIDVGQGRIEAGALPTILRAGDRGAAGRLAPPQGLTLERVSYARSTQAAPRHGNHS